MGILLAIILIIDLGVYTFRSWTDTLSRHRAPRSELRLIVGLQRVEIEKFGKVRKYGMEISERGRFQLHPKTIPLDDYAEAQLKLPKVTTSRKKLVDEILENIRIK